VASEPQGHAFAAWTAAQTGPVVVRRFDGTWSGPVTIPAGSFYFGLAVDAAGHAAIGFAPDTMNEAVSRYDLVAGTWSAGENIGPYGGGDTQLGFDAAGDLFAAWLSGSTANVRRWDAVMKT